MAKKSSSGPPSAPRPRPPGTRGGPADGPLAPQEALASYAAGEVQSDLLAGPTAPAVAVPRFPAEFVGVRATCKLRLRGRLRGGTPGRKALALVSDEIAAPGTAQVPADAPGAAGRCAGAEVSLRGNPEYRRFWKVVTVRRSGAAVYKAGGAGPCRPVYVQLLDLATCAPSAVMDGDGNVVPVELAAPPLQCGDAVDTGGLQELWAFRGAGRGPAKPDAASPRIVGGAADGACRPYLAWFAPWCAGTLINKRFVLTAAQCAQHVEAGSEVFFGVNRLSSGESCCAGGARRAFVEAAHVHPKYDPTPDAAGRVSYAHDLAVVELDRDLPETDYVCPGWDELEPGDGGLEAAGFGSTTADPGAPAFPDLLQKAAQEVAEAAECRPYYGFNGAASLCVAGDAGPGAICVGDVGGPLVRAGRKGDELVGVASVPGARRCGDLPAVFGRVAYYDRWLKKFLAGSKCAGPDGRPVRGRRRL